MNKQTGGKSGLKRRNVLEAATKLFSERGYGGTNMLDVAKSLHVSRPAVYYYFNSKEAILSSLVDEVTVYSKQLAASVADVMAEPVDALFEMVRNHAFFVLQNPLIFRVIERGENDLDDKAKKISNRAKRALMDQFRMTTDRAIACGRFRDVDSGVAALAIIGMCNWCAWWYVPEGRLSREQIADQIASMAIASLLRGAGLFNQKQKRDFADVIAEAQGALTKIGNLLKSHGKNVRPVGKQRAQVSVQPYARISGRKQT